jgi:drug/metabolite transporter (DMT)-like permease
MVDLVLSICCSLAIAAIFKHNEAREWDRAALLTANYWVATGIAGLVLGSSTGEAVRLGVPETTFWILVLVTGSLFISTYFILAWATNVAGMGLATGVMRVSVVLPVLVSWVLWQERPSPGQMAGLLLASAAFFCIATRRSGPHVRPSSSAASTSPLAVFCVLFLLFVSGGVVDTCMKVFDEVFAGSYQETFFLTFVYIVSAAIGTGITGWNYYRRGDRPDTDVFLWGMVLGLCNYGATLFFLRAVARLEAPFVFPANSISIVLGAALIGVYAWGEQLSRLNWIGLGLAAVALALLRT